jgi:uncharacterized caspase-like protein
MKKANLNLMLGAAGVMLALAALDAGSLISDATATMKSRLISGAQSSVVAAKPTKRALLIGINNYKYPNIVPSLAGSLNDVEDMREVLIGKFEFPPENILVLTDSQATHSQIMSAIQTDLIAKTQPGDIVVFHYSGHGSQMKDVTGKMISGLDETIVPYDSRDPGGKVFDISGAELHPVLAQLAKKTRNVTFILDSCHSGTLVRGARVRSIPADARNIPTSTITAMRSLASPDDRTSPRFAFISAATSNESAFEHFAEGKDHGLLTYFLARQLRAAGAGATYRDVMDSVIGNVTGNYPAQHPSLEGAEADQHVFGDGTSLAGTYVSASPSQSDAKRAILNIGQVQGATVGSIYDLYPPGSKKFAPPERPSARVQLASVEAFTSDATIFPGGRVVPASRAIEIAHRYGSPRVLVYLDGVDKSPLLQSIQGELANVKYIEIVDRPTRCNIKLGQAGQSIQTLAADSSPLSTPVPVNDPSAVKRLMGQLQMWAKWFNVLSIRNSQAMIDISFEIKGSQTRDPTGGAGKPDMGVNEGETIIATLTNNSEQDLYVAILDLSSDGSISVVYPTQQGTEEVLKPQLTLSRSFATFVPNGQSTVTDVLKVFASYKPINLTPLTQGAIRGLDESAELDPLEELLLDSTGVSRGVSPLLNKPLDLSTWTTVQRVLRVKRKS